MQYIHTRIVQPATYLLLCLSMVLAGTYAAAQPTGDPEQTNSSRIKSAKIGLITTRLNLTSDQSKNFWPIYDAFDQERKAIRHEYKRIRISLATETASDEDIKNGLKNMMTIRQKEVDMEKNYMTKFLKVISPRQLAALYKAEQDFNGMLLKELGERRHAKKGNN